MWESMMVCLFTDLWQKFKCAVLTVCNVPISTRTLTSTDVMDRLGEAPVRIKIRPDRRMGPINPMTDTFATSRSETTSTSQEERRP